MKCIYEVLHRNCQLSIILKKMLKVSVERQESCSCEQEKIGNNYSAPCHTFHPIRLRSNVKLTKSCGQIFVFFSLLTVWVYRKLYIKYDFGKLFWKPSMLCNCHFLNKNVLSCVRWVTSIQILLRVPLPERFWESLAWYIVAHCEMLALLHAIN